MVEETLRPGASVAVIARRHGVNANQVLHWRKFALQSPLKIPESGDGAICQSLLRADRLPPEVGYCRIRHNANSLDETRRPRGHIAAGPAQWLGEHERGGMVPTGGHQHARPATVV